MNENKNDRTKNNTNSNSKSKTNTKKFNYKRTKYKCQSALSLFTMGVASVSLATFEMADYYHAKTENLNAKSINEQQIGQQIEQKEEIKLKDVAEEYYRENAKEVKASDILNDYWINTSLDDWKKIEKKYGDQFIEVTGEVKEVKFESYDGAFVLLENDKPISKFADYMTVECIFNDKEDIKVMKKLEEGEVVKINGYCKGSELVTVSMYDCEIKEIEKEIER